MIIPLRLAARLAIDDPACDVGGDFGVVGELHGVASATLGHRPHLGSIAEHRGERDFGVGIEFIKRELCVSGHSPALDFMALVSGKIKIPHPTPP